jgi:hypothetical protein
VRYDVEYDHVPMKKEKCDITNWENRYLYRKMGGGGMGCGRGIGGGQGDVVSVISDCTYGSTHGDVSTAELTGTTMDSRFTENTRWNRDSAGYICCHPVVFD